MPLSKGKSKKTIGKNVKELMNSYKKKGKIGTSKPKTKKKAQKQAVAIALQKSANEGFDNTVSKLLNKYLFAENIGIGYDMSNPLGGASGPTEDEEYDECGCGECEQCCMKNAEECVHAIQGCCCDECESCKANQRPLATSNYMLDIKIKK